VIDMNRAGSALTGMPFRASVLIARTLAIVLLLAVPASEVAPAYARAVMPLSTGPVALAGVPAPAMQLDSDGFPSDATQVTASDLYKTPSQYLDRKVTFTCVASTFAKDSVGDVVAVNCYDPNAVSAVLQVDISSFDITQINQGDTLRFYGTCQGAFSGNNSFGAQVTETEVHAIYIDDVTSGYQVNAIGANASETSGAAPASGPSIISGFDANGFPTDAASATVTELYKAPSQYQGHTVTFGCVVSSFVKNAAGDATAVNCYDPNDVNAVLLVDVSKFDVGQINPNDTVYFYGLCNGTVAGTNAFGASITETAVRGLYVDDATSDYEVNAGFPSSTPVENVSPAPGSPTVSAIDTVDVKEGPGSGFPDVARLLPGQGAAIVGKNADGSWWQLSLGNYRGWVAATLVIATGALDAVPVAQITANANPTPGGPAASATDAVNVRSGPGLGFPVVTQLSPGQTVAIVGKNVDSSWWQISLGIYIGWVAATVVAATGPLDAVPVAQDMPSPSAEPSQPPS